DDGNLCTLDTCDPKTGCEHVDASSACEDDNPCTVSTCDPELGCQTTDVLDGVPCGPGVQCVERQVCQGGACVGVPVADGTLCDDESVCTTGDTCDGGACVGDAITCDDGVACTNDS